MTDEQLELEASALKSLHARLEQEHRDRTETLNLVLSQLNEVSLEKNLRYIDKKEEDKELF
jgi:hypothetical protein